MKNLLCFSQYEFDKIMEDKGWNDNNIPEDCAFISIISPESSGFGEEHYFKQNHNNVINLEFEDIFDYKVEYSDSIIYGMNDKQAEELFNFIENNKGKNFYIHCSAGISRSQAVVRFILDYYNDNYDKTSLNPNNPCEFPNLHVLHLLRRCWLKKFIKENYEK